MRAGSVRKGETGRKVTLEVLHLLDVFNQLWVNWFLNTFKFSFPLPLGLLSFFSFLKSVLRSVLKFILCEASSLLEESIVNVGCDTVKRNFLRSGKDISRVDSAKRDSIDSIGSSDEEISWSQSLQNNNTSSSANTRKENDNRTRNNWFSSCINLGLLAGSLEILLLVISRIPSVILVSESTLGGTTES